MQMTRLTTKSIVEAAGPLKMHQPIGRKFFSGKCSGPLDLSQESRKTAIAPKATQMKLMINQSYGKAS